MNDGLESQAKKQRLKTAGGGLWNRVRAALRAGGTVAVCVCLLIAPARAADALEKESPAAALPIPAIDGAVTSIDCVNSGGSLHLLVGVKRSGGASEPSRTELLYTRLETPFREWTKPVRVNADTQVAKLSRGNDAKLAIGEKAMLAVWTLPGNGAFGSGALTSARSEDGGKTWSPGATYGPKTEPNEAADAAHGFRFPAVAARGNEFFVIWIDALDDARRLGFTQTSDIGKTWSPPAIIDPLMCACCPNALVTTPTRIYGLYRNHKPSDMALAMSGDGGKNFAMTPSIENFGWDFEGCPHVGGSIAVLKQGAPRADPGHDSLVCSTWSGDAQHGGVHITRSSDSGATWSKPLRVSETNTSRTSDVAAMDGRLAAAWDELVGVRKVIFAATSNDGGVTWSKPSRLSDAAGTGNSDHPRVASVDGRFLVMWTQADSETSANLRLGFNELPR